MSESELRVLTPTGMLGYGFPLEWFEEGLKRKPDVIAVDSGSTDSGPHKLGLGATTCSWDSYYSELEILIKAGQEHGIPVMVSSAGGDGSDEHVDLFVDIVQRVAKKHGFKLKVAAIYSNIDKGLIKKRLSDGRVIPCGPVPQLTDAEIDDATVIVGQMGVEPYLDVLSHWEDVDVIISGRAYDPVPIAALGIARGFDPALCWHMGKIMECGAICAVPSGRVIFGTLQKDGFILEPMNPVEQCKTFSVAAHTMYEKSHPYLLPGPGGTLDLKDCVFEQLTDRSVRVSGSRFIPADPYRIKLEGSRVVGERAICVAGIRDPILITQIDGFLAQAKLEAEEAFPELLGKSHVIFHTYGKNGVMGEIEPVKDHVPLELCVIIEAVAESAKDAVRLCNRVRTSMLHNPYEGRIATAGNIALPFTPLEIPLGKVCAFNVYHLIEVEDGCELFPIKYSEVS